MNKMFCIKFSNILILLLVFFSSNLSGSFYQQNKIKKPKNIILFIGDGLGLAATSYVIEIENEQLNIETFKIIGLAKTSSYSNYITDSGAGATAIATGHKTYNTAIGVNKDTLPVKNIMETAKEEGLSTGIVVTSSVTHATPAAFVAHVRNRNSDKEIAYSYLNNTIDIFVGGGKKYFDSKILDSLIKLKYTIIYDTIELKNINNNKIVGLLADNHLPGAANRGNMLSLCVSKSIDLLSRNPNGFFLLVEGSQIDWAAHLNDKKYLVDEIKDFDKAIGVALDFARKNENTLVVVTADHETGGIILKENKKDEKKPKIKFCTKDHTGVMVPVYAYGPGAELFSGIYENIDIFNKVKFLLKNE